MNSTELTFEMPQERRDFLLEDAFLQATDSAIVVPNTLQKALFPRLSTQDTGLLVLTGPGAGRLEAVFVPVVAGSPFDRQLHRLYIVAPDNSLLDDYIYRLVPSIRSLSADRQIPVTLFVDSPEPFCRQYLSDGSYVDDRWNHPLDANVDIAVTHFSSFRSLFFGAGGVHALPGMLERPDNDGQKFDIYRRDLFYFDEAQGYSRDEFVGFVKLIEFLYAEDLDIVVGSTTLPESGKEDLSFLEVLSLPDALYQPPRSLRFINSHPSSGLETVIDLVRKQYFESSRAGIVQETASEAVSCYQLLTQLYPQSVICYHSEQPATDRLRNYARIRELEKEGEGYLLICDGKALECGDIDVNLLITPLCAPESFIRRAGRCNRRGDLASGEIVVVGSQYHGRTIPEARLEAYRSAMESFETPGDYDVEQWKSFIA